jgi:predicted Rossmann-fold nucleotide-binding protein
MDEFFEVLTLVQTGKIQDFPLIVMGREYYAKLQELLSEMLRAGTINAADMRYLFYTDSVEELADYIAATVPKFGVIPRPSPFRILRETALRPSPAKPEKTGT